MHSSSKMKPVSIIIITWNNIEETELCLESLNKTIDNDVSIIVVDNGSDEDVSYIIDKYPLNIKLIRNPKNLGYSRAVNQGINESVSDSDIILLNNDIIAKERDWIVKLQDFAYKDEAIGIVGCRLINQEKKMLHGGLHLPKNSFWALELGGNEEDIGQYKLNKEINAVTFALAYIKREAIENVGMLDERYFAYYEDADYCLRAIQKGYKVMYFADLAFIHFQGSSTKSNKLLFNRLYRDSQTKFWDKWISSDFFKYSFGIVWHSIANIPIGYSISSRFIIKELENNRIDVRYKYIYGKDTVFPLSEPLASDAIVYSIQSKPMKNYPIQISYSQGDLFYKNFGKYKIGFTMLEANGLPKDWVEQCNRMNEVWVPSNFNKETFRDAGVRVPIYVMPLGIDIDHFNPHIIPKRLTDKYVFLSIFEWSERKGQELLIKAFREEFSKSDDAVLILKIFNPDIRNNIELELAKIGVDKEEENIIIINADIPYYQLAALYRGADCFVLPTRGEGWGMPIMEAMACQVPVIATEWSAHLDFFNENFGYPLKIKGLVPAITKSPYYKGLIWAEPDYEHLRYLMRYVLEHREEAENKAKLASEFILQNYSWDKVITKMIRRLEEIHYEIRK